jgi:hypothetical protein
VSYLPLELASEGFQKKEDDCGRMRDDGLPEALILSPMDWRIVWLRSID